MIQSPLRSDTGRRLTTVLLDLSNLILRATALAYFKRLTPRPLAFVLFSLSAALCRQALKRIRRNLGR